MTRGQRIPIRTALLDAYRNGHSLEEAINTILRVYGPKAITRATAKKWYDRFRAGDTNICGKQNLRLLDDSHKMNLVELVPMLQPEFVTDNVFLGEVMRNARPIVDTRFINVEDYYRNVNYNPITSNCQRKLPDANEKVLDELIRDIVTEQYYIGTCVWLENLSLSIKRRRRVTQSQLKRLEEAPKLFNNNKMEPSLCARCCPINNSYRRPYNRLATNLYNESERFLLFPENFSSWSTLDSMLADQAALVGFRFIPDEPAPELRPEVNDEISSSNQIIQTHFRKALTNDLSSQNTEIGEKKPVLSKNVSLRQFGVSNKQTRIAKAGKVKKNKAKPKKRRADRKSRQQIQRINAANEEDLAYSSKSVEAQLRRTAGGYKYQEIIVPQTRPFNIALHEEQLKNCHVAKPIDTKNVTESGNDTNLDNLTDIKDEAQLFARHHAKFEGFRLF